MAKPWEKKNTQPKQVRQLQRHLIVCEDEKSAVYYLRAFEILANYVEVVVEGGAGNTISVVEKALSLRDKALNKRTPYAEVWCVFDRDSFPAGNFNRAFDLAKAEHNHNVHIIWANECFELWYLLHFEYHDVGIGRDDLFKKLSGSTRLGKDYDKSDKGVFHLLKDKIEIAKRNSKRLLASYGKALNPERDNPSTNIHELITTLQKLADLEA
jgi:hypothetical protein